jgi:Domain of unknown function (DUF4326)
MFEREFGKDGEFGFNHHHRVYIGRANKTYQLKASPLANPFGIGKHGTREQVVEMYRCWLWKQVKEGMAGKSNTVWDELKYLQGLEKRLVKIGLDGLTLTCWCKDSELCHGDVIVKCLEWMEKNNL